jgi:hypothetical protein
MLSGLIGTLVPLEFTSTYKKIVSIKQLLFKEPHPQEASHFLKEHELSKGLAVGIA